MHDIFETKPVAQSLHLAEERELIAKAQADDGDAVWALLLQYRGILQVTAGRVRSSVRGMTATQVEDLHADLVLAAVEAIKSFDLERFTRLSQTLPGALRDKATEMTTALSVPRGTLALWFKIWRAGGQDFKAATELAPTMGMSANTFRAISHALSNADSEWVNVPWSATTSSPDSETYTLAQHALDVLTPAERAVIEMAYGFSGDPKSDTETAEILNSTKGTVKSQRLRALNKMKTALTA